MDELQKVTAELRTRHEALKELSEADKAAKNSVDARLYRLEKAFSSQAGPERYLKQQSLDMTLDMTYQRGVSELRRKSCKGSCAKPRRELEAFTVSARLRCLVTGFEELKGQDRAKESKGHRLVLSLFCLKMATLPCFGILQGTRPAAADGGNARGPGPESIQGAPFYPFG